MDSLKTDPHKPLGTCGEGHGDMCEWGTWGLHRGVPGDSLVFVD